MPTNRTGSHAVISDARRPTSRWRSAVVLAGLLLLAVLTGVLAALRWPATTKDVYAGVSQVIATLFIAITIEFFSRNKPAWEDKADQVMLLGLIAISWSGLFGCIRAMLNGGTALTAGLAAAGLLASSVLVSLALFGRIRETTRPQPWIVLVFLVPSVLLLML